MLWWWGVGGGVFLFQGKVNVENGRTRQAACLLLEVRLCEGGAYTAQSVKLLTSAQVMISRFLSSSPASGSVLTAQSLEPASDSVSLSLSAPPLFTLSLSPKNK